MGTLRGFNHSTCNDNDTPFQIYFLCVARFWDKHERNNIDVRASEYNLDISTTCKLICKRIMKLKYVKKWCYVEKINQIAHANYFTRVKKKNKSNISDYELWYKAQLLSMLVDQTMIMIIALIFMLF